RSRRRTTGRGPRRRRRRSAPPPGRRLPTNASSLLPRALRRPLSRHRRPGAKQIGVTPRLAGRAGCAMLRRHRREGRMTPESARNIEFVGHCDMGGKGDGVQVMLHKGHAFIGHMFSDGFSVVDVRDPRKPKTVAFVPAPKNTRSHHIQIAGDVLLAVNGPNIWAMQQYASQADYYGKSLIDAVTTEQPVAAGVRTFDVSNPAAPREIGFLHMPGFGAHRSWWTGGRYAYVSVH